MVAAVNIVPMPESQKQQKQKIQRSILTMRCRKRMEEIEILHRDFHHMTFGAKSAENFRAN